MSTCPCCHEPLPDSENPDQLCSECSHALDTGLERLPSASPHQSAAQDHPAKSRPLIITILALQNFLAATCGLLMGVILLVSAKLAAALLTAVSRQSITADLLPFDLRLKSSLPCFFCALLIGLLAVGLWQVRNWARRIVIASFMLDVMFGGSFLLLWPLHTIFDADPVLQILGRLLTFAVVCYLFSRSVKSAFGLADFGHWWLYASAAVALFSLGFALYKSKTEFQAWRWHRQHGNQVQFEGITFPVYRWYVPHVSEADLQSTTNRAHCARMIGLPLSQSSVAGRTVRLRPESLPRRSLNLTNGRAIQT